MKNHPTRKSWNRLPGTLKLAAGLAAACTLFAGIPAKAETVISGQSDTILRMGHSESQGSRDYFPAYEYLRLSVASTEKDGSSTSLHFGGWARGDLGDKSARDRYTDADVQYGYLSYQGAKNNLIFNAGRQFVVEGVAAQKLDGLYIRNDFGAGFGAAAYVGSPVVTEPNFKADDIVFGGRITHSLYKYYTIGISALKSFSDSSRYREEEGVDIWLHPMTQIDVTGRSSYNSLTNGWMEHSYTVSLVPLDNLRLYADISNINYKDYFYRVTTSAFNIFNPITNPTGFIDPNEKLLALGGGIAYTPIKYLTITADYTHRHYDIARTAEYYGGKVAYSLPESFAAGVSVHRMDGRDDKLRYTEYRLYASKKIAQLDLTVDLFNLNYDNRINGVRNAYTFAGAASYEINKNLKIGADVDYSKNPDFDNEVKGLIKLTYLFEVKIADEGRAKSEK